MKTFPNFHLVFLAGGNGLRMGQATPKQYLPLQNKAIALHSFEVFLQMAEMDQCIVVCSLQYQYLFHECAKKYAKSLIFAEPGARRQDSVFNGIQKLTEGGLVCIHDAARPLITIPLIRQVTVAANQWKAAVAGVRVKSTIKICNEQQLIQSTPARESVWEMQTPQVVDLELLIQGFALAEAKKLTVTDDVSLVEHLQKPVKVVESTYTNIKVTTPEDLVFVNQLLASYAPL